MPTSPPPQPAKPHQARPIAESFGTDPERYHRTRPRYPQRLIDAIVAALPGRDVLDVGIGTGVSARPFRAAGCRILGVDVDSRMAQFARQDGFDVEVARFEEWESAGRTFDGIIAGMTWHWIDPVAGAAKAAELLRPEGRLTAFWNIGQPPTDLAQAFSEVYRRVAPDTPFARTPRDPLLAYEPILATATRAIEGLGLFTAPERWRFDWEQTYTTEQWLDQVPTFGGHSQFPPAKLEQLLAGVATAIESIGSAFTINYAAVAITARRHRDRASATAAGYPPRRGAAAC